MREPPRPGEEFQGHLIEGEIGRGGMGIVYRARDLALDRPRALKVIAPELSADPAYAARFRRESRRATAPRDGARARRAAGVGIVRGGA